jgi:phytanoyl-CoA hydroxylase
VFAIEAHDGTTAMIPEHRDEDFDYFDEMTPTAVRYFEEEGYVVVRGVLPHSLCRDLRAAFSSTVKEYPGYLYRQTTARAERNSFNALGYVMNPILNLQDLPPRHFQDLRRLALEAYTHPNAVDALRRLFQEDPKLVQSMYFEGNSATWAHQDSYYLDSEHIGSMIAGWFALEDIHPGAGRFFVYPKSHKIDMQKNGGDFDIAFHHDRYKRLVLDVIDKYSLEVKAPALEEGDMLLWHAKTIHGSLKTYNSDRSRQSLTAHYIPKSHRFLQFQSRVKGLKLDEYNGIQINCPKDQRRLKNQLVLFAESRFPGPFYALKSLAIKTLTR